MDKELEAALDRITAAREAYVVAANALNQALVDLLNLAASKATPPRPAG